MNTLPILIGFFGVSDESGTYNDKESYVFNQKLNLTLTAVLRKYRYCSKLENSIQPLCCV